MPEYHERFTENIADVIEDDNEYSRLLDEIRALPNPEDVAAGMEAWQEGDWDEARRIVREAKQ